MGWVGATSLQGLLSIQRPARPSALPRNSRPAPAFLGNIIRLLIIVCLVVWLFGCLLFIVYCMFVYSRGFARIPWRHHPTPHLIINLLGIKLRITIYHKDHCQHHQHHHQLPIWKAQASHPGAAAFQDPLLCALNQPSASAYPHQHLHISKSICISA